MTTPKDWGRFKLIEEDESGNLILLVDNVSEFQKVVTSDKQCNFPISLITVTGPRSSGKSFYTNLLMEYFEFNGQNWITNCTTRGLRGFAFGNLDKEDNLENNKNNPDFNEENLDPNKHTLDLKYDNPDIFVPDEERSGLYFWPKLVSTQDKYNGKDKAYLVMHVHYVEKAAKADATITPLETFIHLASSQLVEIVWEQDLSTTRIRDVYPNIDNKYHFCRNIAYIVRGLENEAKLSSGLRVTFNNKGSLHSSHGQVILNSNHIMKLDNFFGSIMNDWEQALFVVSNEDSLKITTLHKYLKELVGIVNAHVNHTHTEKSIQHVVTGNQNAEQTDTCSRPLVKTTEFRSYLEKDFIAKLGHVIKESLTDWVNNQLCLENINEMITLCNTTVNSFVETEISSFKELEQSNEIMRVEVRETMEAKANTLSPMYKCVHTSLVKFKHEIDTHVHPHLTLSEDELSKTLESVTIDICKLVEKNAVDNFVRLGCKKLASCYIKLVGEASLIRDISQELIRRGSRFYQDKMSLLVSSSRCSSKELKNMHKYLVKEITCAVMASLNTEEQEISNAVTNQLNIDFSKIWTKYVEGLERRQKKVNSLISQYKSVYEIELENFLQLCSQNVSYHALQRKHEEVVKEVVKKFHHDIHTSLGKDEPTTAYQITLLEHIKRSHKLFCDECSDKPEKVNVNTTTLHEDPTKSHKSTDSGSNNKTSISYSTSPSTSSSASLIIHLTLDKICAISSNSEDSSTKQPTHLSSVVGMLKNKTFVFGDGVNLSENHVANIWHIGKILSKPFANTESYPYIIWSEEVCVNEATLETCKINAAVLLGKLFFHVKSLEEKSNSETYFQLVIVVPFWFTTLQRLFVLDGAKLAGFSDNSYIINESSAAAYYLYHEKFQSRNAWAGVISESSDIIDIFLYNFDANIHNVNMIGHGGNWHSKGSSLNPLTYLKPILKYLRDLGKTPIDKIWDVAKVTGKPVNYPISGNLKIIVCNQTQALSNKLTKVCLSIVKDKDDILYSDNAALLGAKFMVGCSNENQSCVPNEALAFPPQVIHDGTDYEFSLDKKETFMSSDKKHTYAIPLSELEGTHVFFQTINNVKHYFGQLEIKKKLTDHKAVFAKSESGVIEFKSIIPETAPETYTWCDFSLNTAELSDIKLHFPQKNYQVVGDDLTANTKESFERDEQSSDSKDLCSMKDISCYAQDNSKKPQEIELESTKHAKNNVIELGESIQKRIENGKGSFSSPVIKQFVLRQLSSTLGTVSNIDENLSTINAKLDFLVSLSQKYQLLES